MLRTIAYVAAVGVGFGAAWAQQPAAGGKHDHQQPAAKHDQANGATAASPAAAAFEKLKALAGEWKGKGKHGEEAMDVTVRYALTAGGSAVVETEFPGTEHEMTTVYTMDGDAIALTHYCMLGNQPRMLAKPAADAKTLKFECVSVGNSASADAPAMRSLVLNFDGADRVRQEWGMHEKGACISTAVFDLERVKAAPSVAEIAEKNRIAERYFVVLLRNSNKGQNLTGVERGTALGEHGKYIEALRAKGLVKLSGPFVDPIDGGMLLMKAGSTEEAIAASNDLPAVKAGVFEFQVKAWMLPEGSLK